MKNRVLFLVPLLIATMAVAQPIAPAMTDLPAVALSASATAQVENDRMTILLQAESEQPSAGIAAAEVNAKMTKALAIAKSVSAVTAKTLNYSTEQVMEKGKMVRWRVTQLLQVETADFAAGANLATKLQEDGLLLSSLAFSVSPEVRRKAMAKLQHEALIEWQSLARQAATSLGYANYTPGRLAINANDNAPRQRFAARAMAAASVADSVAVAAGSSEMVLTVSGEALLVATGKTR